MTYLYRFFDAADSLLYVGISYHMERRLDAHRYQKPWDRVARIQVEKFPTRDEAATAEREAILTEAPKWNVIYAPLAFPPAKRPSYLATAKAWWPNAEWVNGKGRWATLAYCRVLTVMLHDTQEDAEKALRFIGRIGCGGRCGGDHELVDLDGGKRPVSVPADLPDPFDEED